MWCVIQKCQIYQSCEASICVHTILFCWYCYQRIWLLIFLINRVRLYIHCMTWMGGQSSEREMREEKKKKKKTLKQRMSCESVISLIVKRVTSHTLLAMKHVCRFWFSTVVWKRQQSQPFMKWRRIWYGRSNLLVFTKRNGILSRNRFSRYK